MAVWPTPFDDSVCRYQRHAVTILQPAMPMPASSSPSCFLHPRGFLPAPPTLNPRPRKKVENTDLIPEGPTGADVCRRGELEFVLLLRKVYHLVLAILNFVCIIRTFESDLEPCEPAPLREPKTKHESPKSYVALALSQAPLKGIRRLEVKV